MTGEYGNFTSQLKTAAIDNSWRTPPQILDTRKLLIIYQIPILIICIHIVVI